MGALDNAQLVELAAVVADGTPLNWDAAETGASDEAQRTLVRRLRLVSKIAEFHALASAQPLASWSDRPPTLDPTASWATRTDEAVAGVVSSEWGPLKILELVAHGTFGDVYRAWDTRLDREVALKLIRRRDASSPTDESTVINEGRLMARVRHPNVIAVYGAERIEERVGIWMEFIHGRTLEQDLREQGPFDVEDAASIGVELCRALSAVHRAGLVHRDVKAQNAMRDGDGRVVLGDFGTGREADDEPAPGARVAGTPLYLAPEVLDHAPATPRSDQYSLGVLLYHLVTGVYPVRGRTVRELREAHARQEGPTVADHVPDAPEVFVAIVERALRRDPDGRYADVAEMEAALAAFIEPAAAAASPQADTIGSHAATSDRWRWVAGGIGVLLLAAAVTMLPRSRSGDRQEPGLPVTPSMMTARPVSADESIGEGFLGPEGRLSGCIDRETLDLALCEVVAGERRQVRRLTSAASTGVRYFPGSFSPDGREMAYNVERPDAVAQVRIIGLDGTGDRLVRRGRPDEEFFWLTDWSEAGDMLGLITLEDGTRHIVLLSVSDGSLRPLRSLVRGGADSLERSPDGRFIVYDLAGEDDAYQRDLYLFDLARDREVPLVTHPAHDILPIWLPDGSGILFSSDRLGTMGAWLLAIQEGEPRGEPVLLRDMGRSPLFPIEFTADGDLYYRIHAEVSDVFTSSLDPGSGTPAPLTRVAGPPLESSVSPEWSPAGWYLAYLSDRWPQADPGVVVLDLDTGQERAFHLGVQYNEDRELRWLPDGRLALATRRNDEDELRVRLLDAVTGEVTRIVRLSAPHISFDWTHDGMLVRTRQGHLYLFDIDTGIELDLYDGSDGTAGAMAVSHDGLWVAFATHRSDGTTALQVMPVAGGTPREVYRAPSTDRIILQDWAADGRDLVFTQYGAEAEFGVALSLWRVPVEGGAPVSLGIARPGLRHVRMHPDGVRLAFTAGNYRSETWVMENFLSRVQSAQ